MKGMCQPLAAEVITLYNVSMGIHRGFRSLREEFVEEYKGKLRTRVTTLRDKGSISRPAANDYLDTLDKMHAGDEATSKKLQDQALNIAIDAIATCECTPVLSDVKSKSLDPEGK